MLTECQALSDYSCMKWLSVVSFTQAAILQQLYNTNKLAALGGRRGLIDCLSIDTV